MKRLVSLGVVAGVVGLAVWGYLYAQSRGSAPKYRFARVEQGPLTAAVSATGNLNAVIAVQVGSQVSGQIKELFADFNSVVRKGQVIARIDPEIFEAKVNQARADLDSAQATVLNQQAQVERARADVENARAAYAEGKAQTAKARVAGADTRRDLDRKTELLRRELIAKSEHDSAQAAHDSALAQLESAQAREQSLASAIGSAEAQLRVAEAMLQSTRAQVKQKQAALQQMMVDLDHTTIRAPVDGVVVSRAVDVGQTVAASLQTPTLFTIAQDLTKMQVETSVDEADIGKIALDGPAAFTVDAFPGRTFAGRVTQIRKAAQIVQNVVTYTVVVAVDNPDGKLLPGMTANVKLVVAEKPSVLKVPNAALRFRPPGTEGGTAPGSSAGAPAASGGGSGGRQSVEAIKESLTKQLGLSDGQQVKAEGILQEGRQQIIALQGEALSEQERRARIQRIREAGRLKIREVLTRAQQAKYDRLSPPSGADGRGGTAGRVWVLDGDGKAKPVNVTLGITDGTSSEILQSDLKEGQEVIVGVTGSNARPATGGVPRLRL